MFGYMSGEVLGRAIDDLIVPEEGRTEARRSRDDAIAKGSTQIETIRRHRGGALVHVQMSMRRLDTPDGDCRHGRS